MQQYDTKYMEYRLLKEISEMDGPVGAGVLFEALGDEKDGGISETTIGRYLRRYEQQGYLKSENYAGRFRGRVITEQGRERLSELAAELKQTKSVSDVVELLHNGLDEQLRNVLVTRQILEPEVAALAAQNASEEDLAVMRSILEGMDDRMREGVSMASTDTPFHVQIAKASGNPILLMTISMIRTNEDYSPEIEWMINSTYRKEPSDHWRIYQAIAERNPDKARRIMRRHIENIILMLDDYEAENKKS